MAEKKLVPATVSLTSTLLCSFMLIGTSALADTPQQQMSQTVETLCPQLAGVNAANSGFLSSAEKDVLKRCGELKRKPGQSFDQLAVSQKDGLSNMTSDESSVMGTATVELSGVQGVAIMGRLASLRGKLSSGVASTLPQPSDTRGRDTGYVQSSPSVGTKTVSGNATVAGQNNSLDLFSGYDGGFSQMADYGKWGFFLTGSYGTGEKDKTAREQGFDFDSWSLVSGVDYRFSDRFVLGGAFGYAMTNSSIENNAGDVDLDGFGLSVYGTYTVGEMYFDFIAGYGIKDFDTKRNVQYAVAAKTGGTTTVNQSFSGNTDSTDIDLSLGGGYNLILGAFGITPYARIGYLRSDIDGYIESLDGSNTAAGFGLALAVDDQEVESLATNLGVNLTRNFNTSKGVLTPYLRADWEHEFKNDARNITARFATVRSDFNALNSITIPTDEPDRDYFNLGAGTSFLMPGGYLIFLDYNTLLGYEDLSVHNVVAGLRIEF